VYSRVVPVTRLSREKGTPIGAEERFQSSGHGDAICEVVIFCFLFDFQDFISAQPLHRVLIDVIRDRLAIGVADLDCARIVHTSPDARSIAVRACLRNAGVGTTGLSDCR
jgi:hypothetical protein